MKKSVAIYIIPLVVTLITNAIVLSGWTYFQNHSSLAKEADSITSNESSAKTKESSNKLAPGHYDTPSVKEGYHLTIDVNDDNTCYVTSYTPGNHILSKSKGLIDYKTYDPDFAYITLADRMSILFGTDEAFHLSNYVMYLYVKDGFIGEVYDHVEMHDESHILPLMLIK